MLTRFLSIALLGLVACTASVKSEGKDGTKDPAKSKASNDSSSSTDRDRSGENDNDAEGAATLPEPDQIVTRPEDRPAPSTSGGIRTCPTNETSVKPMKDYFAWVSSKPLSLGVGLDASGMPDATKKWVNGAPEYDAVQGPLQIASKTGWDLSVAERQSVARFEAKPVLTKTSSGKTGFDVWAVSLAPSARRLTVSRIDFAQDIGLTHFETPYKLTAAPAAGEYVSALKAKAFAGYTFAMEVADDCGMGAIADVLGTNPTLEALAAKAGDPKLKEVLIRAGVVVSIAVTSNRPHADVEALVKASGCSSDDAVACRELFTSLDSWVDGWRKGADRPTYDTISTGKDSYWSYMDFFAAALPK
jgi:hypothetical protein